MNLMRMMTDRFYIEDTDGTRSGPFKTRFGSRSIMVFEDGLAVSEGDRIVQPLSDGSERVYIVEGKSASAGSRNIPPHQTLQISEPVAATAPGTVATRPSAGPVATAVPVQEIRTALTALEQAITASESPQERRDEAAALLRSLIAHPVVVAILGEASAG